MAEPRHIGKYEIIDEIGRGGFAVVYKARDTRMGREVALKVIAGNYAQEPDFIERFHQEAMIAASLRHPRIVPVYDFGDADGTLYLAMALIQGRTLRQLLDAQERKRLTLDQALPILSQLAEALDYLAGQSLVHRDVKPANVMVEREERDLCVTLTDFGLVRSLESSKHLTKTASVLGTPDYMAPEQADPQKWGAITPLTDVYAMGVIAYEMLVGRQPFVGEMLTVLRAHADAQPPPPLDLAPDLGADLAQVLTRGLAKPPAERYPVAGALVAALCQVADARARQQVEQAELAQLLDKAQAARKAVNWLTVQSLCVQIMQLDRAHPDALAMMAEATAGLQKESAEEAGRRQRARRYEEGESALSTGQWKDAIAAFEEVAKGNPDFREVQAKLTLARDELQRAQWYDEAIAHAKARRWAEACRTWINVLRGRSDYHGGDAALRLLDAADGLLGQFDEAVMAFQRQKRDLEQAREAIVLYDALVTARENSDWAGVIEVCERLRRLVPDLAGPGDWLTVARNQSEKRPTPSQDRMTWEKDGKEMVRVPAGEFLYGDDKKKIELPEFWIDKTPVTNAEYKRFLEANLKYPVPFVEESWVKPYNWDKKTRSFPQDKADHPVVLVSWEDAAAYAKWAGKRLPTEEEWEKAARGTDGREYPWGAWEAGRCNSSEAGVGGTTPAGEYSPQGDSPYGCVDMSGNVWEWTASDYSAGHQVLRGGSWSNVRTDARATCCLYDTPDLRSSIVGFRCVGVGPGK